MDNSHLVLSGKYSYAGFQLFFQVFASFVLVELYTSSIRVKEKYYAERYICVVSPVGNAKWSIQGWHSFIKCFLAHDISCVDETQDVTQICELRDRNNFSPIL